MYNILVVVRVVMVLLYLTQFFDRLPSLTHTADHAATPTYIYNGFNLYMG